MNRILFSFLLGGLALTATAQSGGISSEMLNRIRQAHPANVALTNALAGTAINQLALNPRNAEANDTYFSHKVPSKGITDQQSSGRCWLFTGLNVMRAAMMEKYGLGSFQFSQSYCFFYDQLEKANLFLQATIDLASKPMDDKTVEWLFKNPLSDGGTFCGVIDVVGKYGLVPAEIMPESYNAHHLPHGIHPLPETPRIRPHTARGSCQRREKRCPPKTQRRDARHHLPHSRNLPRMPATRV